jgi:hypothetical protein
VFKIVSLVMVARIGMPIPEATGQERQPDVPGTPAVPVQGTTA